MRLFIYLYGVFLLSFLSCKKQTDAYPSAANTTSIAIKLDTEDHLYRLNDTWYGWAEEYNGCSPDFHAEYIIHSLQEADLMVKYCNSESTVSAESITISSANCEDATFVISQYEEGEFAIAKISVASEFNSCMLENNGTVYLNFDFFE